MNLKERVDMNLVFKCLGVAICGIVIFAVLGYCFHLSDVRRTEEFVKTQAKQVLIDGIVASPEKDTWGNELSYLYEANSDIKIAKVVSAGYDGKFDTSDDIIGTATDINKSKLVGKWIGKKTKEGFKGLWEGLKEKSDFPEKESK